MIRVGRATRGAHSPAPVRGHRAASPVACLEQTSVDAGLVLNRKL